MKVRFIILLLFIAPSFIISQDLTIEDYTKKTIYIKMRDGVKLYTVIYQPKVTSQEYPILIKRTPYSCKPYGKDMPNVVSHNADLMATGYIFVFQDMRGRYMSEGAFENVKPVYSRKDKTKIDESTDAWDTVDWLVENVKNNNGNVGVYGNSYLGWTSLQAAISTHPAIKAVEAAAPVTDFYFEDFQRYGLLALGYMPVYDVFGIAKDGYKTDRWWKTNKSFFADTALTLEVDYYDYFLNLGPLNKVNDYIRQDNFFWNDIKSHPNYDQHHKDRNLLSELHDIDCAIMIVGGYHDEQNLYGIINAYKTISKNNPNIDYSWVMGPWAHGHQKKRQDQYYLGEIYFGNHISRDFQTNIEFDYFEHHLKGKTRNNNFKLKLFDTGLNKWSTFETLPSSKKMPLYVNIGNTLTPVPSTNANVKFSYISDPNKPVPHIEEDSFYGIPPKFAMTDDQRFTSKRLDVLTFTTAKLSDDMTLLGEIKAQIKFITDQSDADIIVKLIDVYPMDRTPEITDIEGIKMNGYQRLIRTGYIRGRYRNGFEKPEPIVPLTATAIDVELLDVFHTFKKGHKIMIQIQSSMFPMFDRNPQKYISNIYDAKPSDFKAARHTIMSSTRIVLPVLKK